MVALTLADMRQASIRLIGVAVSAAVLPTAERKRGPFAVLADGGAKYSLLKASNPRRHLPSLLAVLPAFTELKEL
jgi:hypothetical protein